MSNNVIDLSQRFKTTNAGIGALAQSFCEHRKGQGSVYWLKENAELLSILECTGTKTSASDLECYVEFYASLADRITFFPQYYRFLTSIALDLEALGLNGDMAEQLCNFVDRQGLAEAELSDLQRGEAMRLQARRGFSSDDDAGLKQRLHRFANNSASFAIPNRKIAYELTHIVFYLSEYGRCDPNLSAQACQSLVFTGILAHMEENADLLSEVCIALRFAGKTPPTAWENWINSTVRDFDRREGGGVTQDHYHEYLVANWACAQMGTSSFMGPYSAKGQLFFSPVAQLGAMRTISEVLFEVGTARMSNWDVMQTRITASVAAPIGSHICDVAAATPEFDAFFEHFARAPQNTLPPAMRPTTPLLEQVN